MVVCTICAADHLNRARCLAQALKATRPTTLFALCLVESALPAISDRSVWNEFTSVTLAPELSFPDFKRFVFEHSVYELCSAVKARFLLWALEQYADEQHFVFLDPDTYPYSDFPELHHLLQSADIVVTPHHVHDESTLGGLQSTMVRTLGCGTFNAGFLGIRRSKTSERFLEWWDSKLRLLCYADRDLGLYCDQRWLDVAPSFFDLTVLRDEGYNVANWNINRRKITLGSNGDYLVNEHPLRFFHFSSLSEGTDMYFFSKYLPGGSPVFTMREAYLDKLLSLECLTKGAARWTYGTYYSGEKISPHARHILRTSAGVAAAFADPFTASNAVLEAKHGELHAPHVLHTPVI